MRFYGAHYLSPYGLPAGSNNFRSVFVFRASLFVYSDLASKLIMHAHPGFSETCFHMAKVFQLISLWC